ncbi:hypothetical protein SAMN05216388_10264 [Halorientalis persicus]|uniref:Uncharacterized protein n=1 Tax=Halorientalis persicus TaxID=1367881 RepID=A0A1H8U7D6_9EURY|nr:hypothetical protein [Halorientalis persicus]SEO98996.1 hypothetical protein SAMN05216388_10264 [Halorientalis persicus]
MTETKETEEQKEVNELFRIGADEFQTVDSIEEAHELLDRLERGKVMLKSVVQGDGMMAGRCDELRPSRYGDKFQVQPPLIGQCHHSNAKDLAQDIYEKQLEVKLVEWEDRIPSSERGESA